MSEPVRHCPHFEQRGPEFAQQPSQGCSDREEEEGMSHLGVDLCLEPSVRQPIQILRNLRPALFACVAAGCGDQLAGPEDQVDLTGAAYGSAPIVEPSRSRDPDPDPGGLLSHVRLLWIESKGVYCGAGCYDAEHRYRPLLDRYRELGARIDVTHGDPLHASDLAGYDMVWLALPANWYGAFSTQEAELIGSYVEAGGALQILSDGVTAPNQNLWAVTERLGLSVAVDAADYYAFTNHSLFGARTVVTAGCGAVDGGLSWAMDGYTDGVVGVLDEIDAGRVLLFGDANAFTAPSLDSPYGDNATVSDIAVFWLLGLQAMPADMSRD